MVEEAKDTPQLSCRAAGVAIERGRVLLERLETVDFWTLPGGQIKFGEASEEALRREMREELNVDVEVERLLWVAEGFFTYDDKPVHELGFYYLMFPPASSELLRSDGPFLGAEGPLPLIFEWHSLDYLSRTELQPAFLRRALLALPEKIEHVVFGRQG